jgi:Holliday junction resolvase RusA-like endonuclease
VIQSPAISTGQGGGSERGDDPAGDRAECAAGDSQSESKERAELAADLSGAQSGASGVTPGAQVRVTIRYLWPGRRSVMDHDNAVGLSKYILDSFTIAEIWGDDSQVVGVEIEQEKLDKTGRTVYRNGCTVVDIEEV